MVEHGDDAAHCSNGLTAQKFRDVTGESMADNAIAAVFGTGESTQGDTTPGEEPMGDVSVSTASATQLAEAHTIRRGSNK